ncbi:MAG: hypothetical protein GY800_08915 [Planctomycetes bacterium]|nr:hypothetical protein [Planctomycetota bacterium]
MRQVNISDETFEFLEKMAKDMLEQSNRGTAAPYFFQIEETKKIWGIDRNYSDNYVYIYEGEEIAEDLESLREYLIENYCEDEDDEPFEDMAAFEVEEFAETKDIEKCYWVEHRCLENVFFTEIACLKHIEINGHNLSKPRTYVSHGFRNPELMGVVEAVFEITGVKTKRRKP